MAYYREDTFLPFFPTPGLGVKRAALDAVDGFRVLESGGDADLCWRIQLAGFRDVEEIAEPLIEWRPRTRIRSLVQQWAKYGRSNALLRHDFRASGATAPEPQPTLRLIAIHVRRTMRTLRRERLRNASVVVVDAIVDIARDISYGQTMRALRSDPRRLRV